MNRAFLYVLLLLFAACHARAKSLPILSISTDSTGITYRINKTTTTRDAIIEIYADGARLGGERKAVVSVDANTSFLTICEFLRLLKEKAGVEKFEISVAGTLKGQRPPIVGDLLKITSRQLETFEPFVPPPTPPGEPQQTGIPSNKPWTPAPPKIVLPPIK